MNTKQVPIDGSSLHFDVVTEDDGHVTYNLVGETQTLGPIASFCPDTSELTLFDVRDERMATDVVQTQLNATTAVLTDNPVMAMMVGLSELFGNEADRG